MTATRPSSLPAIVGTLPPFEPLRNRRRWGFLARPTSPLRIGLCCSDSSLTHMELRQPLSLDAFSDLLSHARVQWYSLQLGPRTAERASYPTVTVSATPLSTFAETADKIAGLDAVVTVDTSVAHLAGAPGVPTWLLLHVVADFRWALNETTPWYPSMRLIRQRNPGDWDSAIDALAFLINEYFDG